MVTMHDFVSLDTILQSISCHIALLLSGTTMKRALLDGWGVETTCIDPVVLHLILGPAKHGLELPAKRGV